MIAAGAEPVRDDELDLALRVRGREPLRRRPHQAAQVDVLPAQLALGDAGEEQQALDELRHVLRRLAHAAQVIAPLVVELVRVVLEEGLAEAVDAPQRGAQIVGDRVAERLQLAAGRLGGLLGLRQRPLGALALGDVADGAGDEEAVHRLQGAQADLHGELGAVPAQAEELQAGAHEAHLGVGEVAGAVTRVPAAEARGDEHLHRLPEQLAAAVAEEALGLGVDEHDAPLAVDDHHRVGGRLEQGRGEAGLFTQAHRGTSPRRGGAGYIPRSLPPRSTSGVTRPSRCPQARRGRIEVGSRSAAGSRSRQVAPSCPPRPRFPQESQECHAPDCSRRHARPPVRRLGVRVVLPPPGRGSAPARGRSSGDGGGADRERANPAAGAARRPRRGQGRARRPALPRSEPLARWHGVVRDVPRSPPRRRRRAAAGEGPGGRGRPLQHADGLQRLA